MKCLSVILAIATVTLAFCEEPEALTLDVITLPTCMLCEKGAELVSNCAAVEQGALSKLIRHKTGRENFLYHKIQEIRQIAKTDPARAEKMAQAVIDQFKKYGVTL